MFLHKVYMSGFKSYSQSAPKLVEFIQGVNCLVGPNGKGKSNIVDAICFALGFDIKQLRVSKLDDLLTTRGEEKEPYAHVQLIFSRCSSETVSEEGNFQPLKEKERNHSEDLMEDEQDEQTLQQTLPKTTTSTIEGECSKQHELSVTIFKNKNARKYKLDGKHVSLREVQSFLFKNGLRNCANYVILQNQVIALSFKDPKKLAEMITDESGGLNFQQKVEKALHDLEVWKGTEKHIKQQIDKLKKVIEEDMRRIKLVQEKQSVEADLRQARIAVKLSRKTELEGKVALKLEEQKNVHQTMVKLQDEINEIELNIDIDPLSKCDDNTNATGECLEELDLKEKNRQDLEFNLDLIQEEISQLEEKRKQLLLAFQEQTQLDHSRKHRFQELTQNKAVLDARLLAIEVVMKSSSQGEITHTPQQLATELKLAEQSIDSLNASVQRLTNLVNTIESEKSNAESLVHQLENGISSFQGGSNASLDEAQRSLSQMRDYLTAHEGKLRVLKSNHSYLTQILHSHELDLFPNSTLINKITLNPNTESYLLALFVIAGRNIFNIITRTTDEAEQVLVKYTSLKRQCVIWPMDRLDATPQRKKIDIQRKLRQRNDLEFFLPMDLIQFDPEIETAVQRCFGDFVISSSNDMSKKLLELGISSVTLDGVKHIPGRIIGGDFSRQNSTNIISQKLRLQSAEKQMKEEEEIVEQVKLRVHEQEKLTREIASLQQMTHRLKLERERLDKLNKQKHNLQQRISKETIEIEELKVKKIYIEEQLNSNNAVQRMKSEHEQLTMEKETILDEIEEIEQQQEGEKISHNHLQEIELEVSKMKEKEQHLKDDLGNCLTRIEELSKRYETMKKHQEEGKTKSKKLLQRKLEIEKSLKAMEQLEKSLFQEITSFQKEISSIEQATSLELYDHDNAMNTKSVEELEVIIANLEKKFSKLKKKAKNLLIDSNDVERKQQTLNNSLNRVEWIKTSCDQLKEGIAQGQQIVDRYNQIAFEKISSLFIKYTSMMLANKECHLAMVGEKVSEGIEFIVKHKSNMQRNSILPRSKSNESQQASQSPIPLNQLSGGEKTMLSLAFLFALATFKNSMFYILDEIDANLDEEKQKIVARILTTMFKDKQQVIMISHNSALQSEADRIVHI
ncbi:hypothetical protein C9374_009995 [Naegleria lovaniensis]|uniref:Structural maintenance of chromosomes protein n=1 Tax=Naegleria lovaniensis TaxID=51637 RepID=A0AA88GGX4_NAELO|nr:uncharacterized protein C9374_009995 [Naegleria lovaniensis]KAG2375372.1 hypothetical protein C9374_009995 [Naegleria lovaniensis]